MGFSVEFKLDTFEYMSACGGARGGGNSNQVKLTAEECHHDQMSERPLLWHI
jgi:hypothetical protein